LSDSEDKPYSAIFASLNHPVRRKILRMLSQKPMSFSEILEALGVSGSFLTYHIENLGELVGKTNDSKYRLSSFGEAAIATMTRVEDIPRSMSSQNENLLKSHPKSSIAIRIITHVYILALVVSVILAGLYLVNYTSSEIPFSHVTVLEDLLLHPGENFTFYIAIDHRPMASYLAPNDSVFVVYGYRFDENHTYWFPGPPTGNTLTSWSIESVHFLLNPYADIEFSRALVWNETAGATLNPEFYYSHIAAGIYINSMDLDEVTEPSLYEFVITNVDPLRDLNDTLHTQNAFQDFEKPVYYYGVAGLLAGIFYPSVIIAPRVMEYATRRNRRRPTG